MDIILYLLATIQQLNQIIFWLLNFICRYIPLKQWAFEDPHSPKYQKFKIDELPKIVFFDQDWDCKDLISYYQKRYGKLIKPVFRHNVISTVPLTHKFRNFALRNRMLFGKKAFSMLLCIEMLQSMVVQ